MEFLHTLLLALIPCLCTSVVGQGDMNVYDQQMKMCSQNQAVDCTYSPTDGGAHQVCVTELPRGFSSDTGQGTWSDEFTGHPWCICVWAYSNYVLQNKSLTLKCESIPSKVLEAQYSLDKFKQCDSDCGPEDIRRSIQSLCEQCDQQAPDDNAKSSLKSKCDAILSSAPPAPMTLYSINDALEIKKESPFQSTGGSLVLGSCLLGVPIAAFLVGLVVRKVCERRSQQRGEQQVDHLFDEQAVE